MWRGHPAPKRLPTFVGKMRKGIKPGLSCVLSILPLVSRRDLRPPRTYLQKKKKTSSQHAEPQRWMLRSRGTDLTPGCGMLLHSHSFCPEDIHLPSAFVFSVVSTHRAAPAQALNILWQCLSCSDGKGGFFIDSCSPGALSRLVQKGHSRMGDTGYGHSTAGHCWEGIEFFKAHFAHRPRATCSCSTASFQTQLVFEEIPWESLTDKINQHWEGTVVDGNLKWQSFTLF